MIYLLNISQAQELMIPRTTDASVNSLKFRAYSNTGKNEPVNLSVVSLAVSPNYYTMGVSLPSGLSDGEYDYYLENNKGEILSYGILIIGNYDRHVNTYEEKTTFIQYED